MILTALAVWAASAPAAECPLVGSWQLLSASAADGQGHRDDAPYGAGVTGTLVYTADGRVVVLVSNGGRKPLSSDDRASAPASERAEAFATFFSYAGRYEVVGDHVIHHVDMASVPNWVGTDMVRTFRCEGDRLFLTTPPRALQGSKRTFTLVWKRNL